MKSREKLEAIRKELEISKKTIEKENISLFVNFLIQRGFQKILEFCPGMDELIVVISFDEKDHPSMKLSNYITLHGSSMFPFTRAFTDEVAFDIQNLEGTDDDIGIEVSVLSDENGKNVYEFTCNMS